MKKHLPVLLLAVFVLVAFCGCGRKNAAPAESLVGTWKDSYGLTEYEFKSDGKMKIAALNLGSCSGTYAVNGDKISIRYRVLIKDVKDVYTIRLNGDTLYMDKNKFTRKK